VGAPALAGPALQLRAAKANTRRTRFTMTETTETAEYFSSF